jgi:hypothetical protein
MEINKLRSIIKEAVDAQLKEIEAVAENAAMEARLAEYDKAIKMCEDKIATAENLEEIKDLVDEGKIKEIKNKLKSLQKAKDKLEKTKAKKNKGKEVVTDEPVEESAVEEGDKYNPENSWNDEEVNDPFNTDQSMEEEIALNESFLKMQKLAGVITESQYNEAFDQKMTDIAMGFSNTDPKNTPGATAGTPPKKEDTNVKTIMTRLKPLVAQLRANDTTNEFFDLLKSMIDLIQSINKDALSDTEVVMGLNNLLVAKRKEINSKK